MKCLIALILTALLLAGCTPWQQIPEQTVPTDPPVIQTEPTQPATEPVTEPEIPTLVLDTEEVLLCEYGETCQLYTGQIDMAEITWVSADEAIATVDGGVVTAVTRGETVITAQFADQSVSCSVICKLPVQPVLNPEAGAREPMYLPAEVETVDSTFFDDAVFVGDSVSLKLSYYAASSGKLGSAQFLTRGSYGVSHAIKDTMLLPYQGQEMRVEDAIAATGASKVFLMLGMNDIALYGIDPTIENWGVLIARIRDACPDVTIYIQSMTPIWTGGEKGSLNNKNTDLYNEKLEIFAQENGLGFINVAPYMKDSTGGIATRYCSDNYVHLTDLGADTWIRALKAYDY